MKCLEKDRARRYETASGLAADLQRHLNDEPVVARPPSRLYEFQKTVRRHKVGFAATAAVIVALMAGVIASTLEAVRATRAERERGVLHRQAEQEALTTRQHLYAADMYLAQHALEDGNFGLARKALEAHRPKSGEIDLRGFEWRYYSKLSQGDQKSVLQGHSNVVSSLAVSSDGKWLASGSYDATVRLWELPSVRLVKTLPVKGEVFSLAFSPDGLILAIGHLRGAVELLEIATEKILRPDFDAPWADVAFRPGKPELAIVACPGQFAGDGTIWLWDYSTNRVTQVSQAVGRQVAFSPDGSTLAIGGDQRLVFLNVVTGEEISTNVPRGSVARGGIIRMTLSPDGKTLATVCPWDSFVRLWDVGTGAMLGTLEGHTEMVWCTAFSPDGKLAATGSSDQTVRLWNVANRKQLAVLKGHLSEVWSVAFSSDGRTLFTGGLDRSILLWEVNRTDKVVEPENIVSHPFVPVISPDGRSMAATGANGQVGIWNLETCQQRATLASEVAPLAFCPDGTGLITWGTSGDLTLWDTTSYPFHATKTLKTEPLVSSSPPSFAGSVFLTLARGGQVVLWNAASLQPIAQLHSDLLNGKPDEGLLLLPDGQTVMDWNGENTETWSLIGESQYSAPLRTPRDYQEIAFSPDGTVFAICDGGEVKLWSTSPRQEIAALTGHKTGVNKLAFSPDGKTLASAGGGRIKLWNVATAREVGEIGIYRSSEDIRYLTFTPDGDTLIFSDWVGTVHLLKASPNSEMNARVN